MPFYTEKLGFDPFDEHCVGSQLKFSWLPRQCYQTGKSLWFKRAYRRSAVWKGSRSLIWKYRWYDKHEYFILKLRGEV